MRDCRSGSDGCTVSPLTPGIPGNPGVSREVNYIRFGKRENSAIIEMFPLPDVFSESDCADNITGLIPSPFNG
jgi:hypothetical protein